MLANAKAREQSFKKQFFSQYFCISLAVVVTTDDHVLCITGGAVVEVQGDEMTR